MKYVNCCNRYYNHVCFKFNLHPTSKLCCSIHILCKLKLNPMTPTASILCSSHPTSLPPPAKSYPHLHWYTTPPLPNGCNKTIVNCYPINTNCTNAIKKHCMQTLVGSFFYFFPHSFSLGQITTPCYSSYILLITYKTSRGYIPVVDNARHANGKENILHCLLVETWKLHLNILSLTEDMVVYT